jgi:tRNA 2-selenouridine synthase
MISSIIAVTDLSPQHLALYDDIIDVRSPSEFEHDRIPGAINLPVLDDEERARVGTVYVQESSFLARRMGASLVAANISRIIDERLCAKPRNWRPLIYCWRGGMRSRSLAIVLSEVGWRPALIDGGYRQWRRHVVEHLDASDTPLPVVLIDGQTGTGKTRLLREIREQGGQVIDLEFLARHRGSAFGAYPGAPQPSQKLFETLIWQELRVMDPHRAVFVEAESRQIGRLRIPTRLWSAMERARRIELRTSASERSRHLVADYEDLYRDTERLLACIDRLRPFHSRTRIDCWRELARAGDFRELAGQLIVDHYDPLYLRLREARHDADTAETMTLDDLSEKTLRELAATLVTRQPPHPACAATPF